MHGGDGQVDDELDAGVGEDVGGGSGCRNPVLLSLRSGPVREEVAEDEHLDVGEALEVLEVRVADHADADEPDADRSRADGCEGGHQARPRAVRNS